MKVPKVFKPISCQSVCQNYKECYIHYKNISDDCLMYGYINGTSAVYEYLKLRELTNESTQSS